MAPEQLEQPMYMSQEAVPNQSQERVDTSNQNEFADFNAIANESVYFVSQKTIIPGVSKLN
jgi:hypothetical protein